MYVSVAHLEVIHSHSVTVDQGFRHGHWHAMDGVAQKHYMTDIQPRVVVANAGVHATKGCYHNPRAEIVVFEGTLSHGRCSRSSSVLLQIFSL